MKIILRPRIEADVQPGDAMSRGAEPDGSGADAGFHGVADGPPEGELPLLRGGAHELCEVRIVAARARRARRDEDRVAAQAAERDRFAVRAKVFAERFAVDRHAGQRRARHEDAFERAPDTLIVYSRAFPAVGVQRARA